MWNRKIVVDDKAIGAGTTLTLKQSLLPCALVTSLFFLWGFAYGLLDVLNSHFQAALNISPSMASGLSSAYFGAYFICPLTISGWILRRYGFRVTFMSGLAILAVGCLLFWPSGVKRSFGGFCGSMFVVGAGLSTLETGADNFLSICGPPKYSEIRLNFAQGFNGIGTFAAPLLASRVFFAKTVDTSAGLANVQWVYLGVAGFVLLLIPLFYLAPMPEVTDADMSMQEVEIEHEDVGPLKKQYNLFLAIWAEFMYVAAQVAVANYFMSFCEEAGLSSYQASNMLALGQGLYTVNRFGAAAMMMWPRTKPRLMLAVYLAFSFIFALAATLTTGKASIAMLILVLCAESLLFPTIFTLGLRGLGRHTKLGGSFLVSSVSGGAVGPPICGAVADRWGFHTAMAVPAACYAAAYVYPVYINTVKRKMMDSHRETNLNVTEATAIDVKTLEVEKGGDFEMDVQRVEKRSVHQTEVEA